METFRLLSLIKKPFVALWFVTIAIALSTLMVSHFSHPPVYNAGLLETLAIEAPEQQVAIKLSQNYQKKLLLLVGNESAEKASQVAKIIRENFSEKPWLESIYSNPINSDNLQQLISFYSQSFYAHIPVDYAQALSSGNKTSLNEIYFTLLNQWADPIVSQSLELDPTLSVAGFLKERLSVKGNWQIKNQQLMLQSDALFYVPIFINLAESALDIEQSSSIYQQLLTVKEQYQDDNKLLMAGMLLHSASATAQAKSEITTFGLFSLVAVFFLVVAAFRTIKPIVASFSVVFSALLFGLCAVTLFFQTIHLLAFVFAVSILGIAIDYAFHVLVLRQYSEGSASEVRSKIFIPLTVALISTIVGYSLFFLTPIQLLHQVVIFVGFGLIGAYFTAITLLPHIEFNGHGSLFSFIVKPNGFILVVASLLLVISSPLIVFDDNIANLNTRNTQLVTEEKAIVQLTGESIYPYTVIVNGASQEGLLEEATNITQLLADRAETNQEFKSISNWVFPLSKQQANWRIVKDNWDAGSFDTIKEYIDGATVDNQLAQKEGISELPEFLSQSIGLNIIASDGRYWTAILSSTPLNKNQLTMLDENTSATYIDLPKELSLQLTEVRKSLSIIVIPAAIIILLLLAVQYGWRSGFVMTLVPFVAAGLALVFSAFIQSSLNIFNLLACLLIFTLSIDYVVFFRAHGHSKIISHTISLSALSSALTFGVMIVSKTPAVSSFGLTLLVGIIISWGVSHVTPFTPSVLIKDKNK